MVDVGAAGFVARLAVRALCHAGQLGPWLADAVRRTRSLRARLSADGVSALARSRRRAEAHLRRGLCSHVRRRRAGDRRAKWRPHGPARRPGRHVVRLAISDVRAGITAASSWVSGCVVRIGFCSLGLGCTWACASPALCRGWIAGIHADRHRHRYVRFAGASVFHRGASHGAVLFEQCAGRLSCRSPGLVAAGRVGAEPCPPCLRPAAMPTVGAGWPTCR